jgi:predicted DNA-binding transcriptional regulator AlpA
MPAAKQRLVDGPEEDYLDADQVAAYLHFSADTLRRLVKAGKFPQPLEMSDQTRVWSWRDVLFWTLTVELRPRMASEPEAQRAAKRGQPPASGEPAE